MARSDLLINLVKSGASGDKHALGKIVNAIVAEERAKNHNIFADRIEKSLPLEQLEWKREGCRTDECAHLRIEREST